MRRREFIALLGSAAIAHPLAVRAKQPALPLIGFLSSGSSEAFAPLVAAFRDGLREAGYVEGQNVAIEFAWAAGRYDKLSSLAADLVSRQVALIVGRAAPAQVVARAVSPSWGGGGRCRRAGGQGRYVDHPHCACERGRPGKIWPGRQFEPTDRQYHGRNSVH